MNFRLSRSSHLIALVSLCFSPLPILGSLVGLCLRDRKHEIWNPPVHCPFPFSDCERKLDISEMPMFNYFYFRPHGQRLVTTVWQDVAVSSWVLLFRKFGFFWLLKKVLATHRENTTQGYMSGWELLNRASSQFSCWREEYLISCEVQRSSVA